MRQQTFWLTTALWLALPVVGFIFGRATSSRSPDFAVYRNAAISLRAGRTDLYSDTFAATPPQIYVYPPLFVFLTLPLTWFSFENAFGLWVAAMTLAVAAVIRSAYRHWKPQGKARYAVVVTALAGPYIVLSLKSGNVHLYIVLLTVLALMAWSKSRQWLAALEIALGGAIKVLPLFVLPVFLLRREWNLALRTVALTLCLWLLPVFYFGPRETLSLLDAWYDLVIRDIRQFQNERSLDLSLSGATERWFTHVDYSVRRDRNYPQATVIELPRSAIKVATTVIAAAVVGLSAWIFIALRNAVASQQHAIISSGSILITAQLFLGPYTPPLYLSGWLLMALASFTGPAAGKWHDRLVLTAGTLNLLLIALPGGQSARTTGIRSVYAARTVFVDTQYSPGLFISEARVCDFTRKSEPNVKWHQNWRVFRGGLRGNISHNFG